ncbi:MAG TPA: GNAT family N-acetyltransferase [Terriglobales bacterium]|jgi:GNAT superfamily N-acetyltransferase|nr:GNAT family N-acetyltransferase [Terriglobales bacterium]
MKFVDMELARRLELAGHPDWVEGGNRGAGIPNRGRPENARIAVGGGIAEFRGINSPVTQAEGLGLNGPVSEEEFERLEVFFRSRGSAVFIEVCPMADQSFIETLGKRSYRVIEFSNMLMREIGEREKLPPPAPGVTIRPAEPGESRLFAETVSRGFSEHFEPTDELISTIQEFFTGAGLTPYLAFLDGKLAGGGTLGIRKGVAGLFGTSTLSEFRKRGIQSALIAARLEVGRSAGCDLAMSITLPASGSQRNLERQGFRVVYTRTKFTREWA